MIEAGLLGVPCAELTPLLGREFTKRIACFSGFLGVGDVFVYADGNHSEQWEEKSEIRWSSYLTPLSRDQDGMGEHWKEMDFVRGGKGILLDGN